jgi:hypothetical protein
MLISRNNILYHLLKIIYFLSESQDTCVQGVAPVVITIFTDFTQRLKFGQIRSYVGPHSPNPSSLQDSEPGSDQIRLPANSRYGRYSVPCIRTSTWKDPVLFYKIKKLRNCSSVMLKEEGLLYNFPKIRGT